MANKGLKIVAVCQYCGWEKPAGSDEQAKRSIADHMNQNTDCLYGRVS